MLLAGLWLGIGAAQAQDATWLPPGPTFSDWNTATNWTPNTVPTGTASFGASNTRSLTFSSNASVSALQFNALAPAYSFSLAGTSLTITGTGVINDSSNSPTFTIGAAASLIFQGASVAGNAIIMANSGGTVVVNGDTDLGTAPLTLDDGVLQVLAAGGGINSSKPIVLNDGGGTFSADSTTSSLLSGAISGPGSLTMEGAGTLTLTGPNAYGGGTHINGVIVAGNLVGDLAVINDGNLGTGSLSFDGGTLEVLSTGGGILSSKAITLSASGGTFQADAGTTSTLSGAISGEGSLSSSTGIFRKVGPGTLILSGTNTYTGVTIVQEGTLQAGSSTALSPNAGISVFSLLDLNGFDSTVVFLEGVGTVTNNSATPVNLTVGSSVVGGVPGMFSGTLTDGSSPLTLIVTTGGQLTLAGTNTYRGGTQIVNGGILVAQTDANLGTGPLLFDGGTLFVGPFEVAEFDKPVTLNFGGGTLAVSLFSTTTLGGLISGIGALTESGLGTLLLTQANSYLGGTNILLGTVQVNGDSNLGTGPLSFDSGTLEALGPGGGIFSGKVITLNSGGGTFLADTGTTSTLSGPIIGVGSWTKDGLGTLILSGVNTYSGATNVILGTLEAGSSRSFSRNSAFRVNSVLDLNGFDSTIGSLSGTGVVTNNSASLANLTVGLDNTNTNFRGSLRDGRGGLALTKTGLGTLTLVGANGYSGATNVASGTLRAGSATGLSAHSAFIVTSRLDLNGFNSAIGSLAGTGTVTNQGSTSANLTVGAQNTDTTFSGVLTDGRSSLELTKIGRGKLTLTGFNPYSGGTHINGGTLAVNSDRNLGNGPLGLSSGTLEVLPNGGIVSNQSITLTGEGGTFLAEAGTASTLNGGISGTGQLTKDGLGTLILTGANTYSGGTTLSAGTLTVHGAQALGRGNVVVSGGTLNADPQPINVAGNYTQMNEGTLQLQVAGAHPGQYDSLNVAKNAQLGGILQLISLGFRPKGGNLLTLVRTGGVVSGRFAQFLDPFFNWDGPHSTAELLYEPNAVQLLFLNSGAAASVAGLTAYYEISFSNANIQRLNLESRMDELHNGSNGFSSNMKVNGATVNTDDRTGADGKSSKTVVEPILQPGPGNRWGVWMTGFGDFVSVDADANANGYNFTTGGVSLGVDYHITDQLVIGLMGEYAHTWTSLQPSGNLNVNSGRGGLYATWYHHGIYLNAAIYGGYNSYNSSRSAPQGLASGSTEGAELSTFFSGGYDFHFGLLTVGPIAALQYTYANIDGFSENGSLAPLQIESGSANSLRSDVGFRLSYQWQIGKVLLQPSLRAAWEHEYLYSALPITAAFVGIPGSSATFLGPREGHDSAIVSAGISAQWTPALTVYLNYDGQLGRDNFASNAVTGGVRISF